MGGFQVRGVGLGYKPLNSFRFGVCGFGVPGLEALGVKVAGGRGGGLGSGLWGRDRAWGCENMHEFVNPKPKTPNPKPETLNPKPSSPHPEP